MESKITKAKILAVDDLSEVKQIGEEKQEAVLKAKIKKENKNKDTVEVTREKITKESEEEEKNEGKTDDKAKEFPEFELAFDPFADQSK